MGEPEEFHPVELPTETLLQQCQIRLGRAGGPGGQHRNKVETAVRITHLPSGLVGQASERRSQAENRRQAVRRLRLQLAIEIRRSGPVLPAGKYPEIWRSRLRSGRIEVSEDHDDFPVLVAIALEVLAIHDYDAALAAQQLDCSTTQLIRFLAREPSVMTKVNRQREALGKHKYRPGR